MYCTSKYIRGELHLGKSATIRESNHGSGVCNFAELAEAVPIEVNYNKKYIKCLLQ